MLLTIASVKKFYLALTLSLNYSSTGYGLFQVTSVVVIHQTIVFENSKSSVRHQELTETFTPLIFNIMLP